MTVTASAILRTRNRPEFFRQSLASALAQTHDDTEVIVVEDGGDAYAANVARALGADHVTIIRNDTRLGIGPTSKRGLDTATGEFVAFLDDDDLWDPDFLSVLAAPLAADDGLVAAFCRRRIVDADGAGIGPHDERNWEGELDWPTRRGIVAPFVHEALVSPVIAVAQSTLIRREALDWSFLPDTDSTWDNRVVYELTRTGLGVWFEPAVLTSYRVHDGGISTDPAVHDDRVAAYRRYVADPDLAEWSDGLEMRLAAHLEARARLCDDPAGLGDARRDIRESVRLHPSARALWALPVLHLPFPLATRALRAGRRLRRGAEAVRRRRGVQGVR